MSVSDDRLLKAIESVIKSLAPEPRFYGLYEYEVIGGSGATGFALKATIDSMPDLAGVTLWKDSVATVVYTTSARVLVGFVNGDPSRPVILHDGAIIRHGDVVIFPSPSSAPIIKVPAP